MMEQPIDTQWGYVADAVMGGLSQGHMEVAPWNGRQATILQGQVSLQNNGGFVQIATDLPAGLDAAHWDGLALDVAGNDERYDIRLRTGALARPWQSYRADFVAGPDWATIRLPFSAFAAHKHAIPFDAAGLTRIGLLAIGRVFTARLAVAGLRLYRDA